MANVAKTTPDQPCQIVLKTIGGAACQLNQILRQIISAGALKTRLTKKISHNALALLKTLKI